MPTETAISAIKKGVKYWNDWRKNNQEPFDFKYADLKGITLDSWKSYQEDGYDIAADLSNIDFTGANLTKANLYSAILDKSVFENAILIGTRLTRANCIETKFKKADLTSASLHKAKVDYSDFTDAILTETDFTILSCKGIKLKGAVMHSAQIEEPFKGIEGPWSVDPYQLTDIDDLTEVEPNSQTRIKDYLTNVFTDLNNLKPEDIRDQNAYLQLLDRTNSLLRFYKEDQLPASFRLVLDEINLQLINYLRQNPRALYNIHWRTFEELIAEIFRSFGWEVELTAPTKDGGYDILAIYKDENNIKHHFLVECKHWSAEHKVGVEVLRALYGVKTSLNVGNALVATTSFFTHGAANFKASNYGLATKNFNDIVSWVNEYKPSPSGKLYISDDRIMRQASKNFRKSL